MPIHQIPLPETYLSITRRVARSAIDALFYYLLVPSDTIINYSGEAGQSIIWNSNRKQMLRYNPDYEVKYSKHDRLKVSIDEEVSEDHSLVMYTHYNDAHPLFSHEDYALSVTPIYDRTTMHLTCEYRAENRENAEKFRNMLRINAAKSRGEVPFEIKYFILMDKVVFAALYHAWTLQENISPYGISFDDWLNLYTTGHLKPLKQLNGQNESFAFEEMQSGALLTFSEIVPPKREKEDSGSANIISFDVSFTYDKPIATNLVIPLVIHNQMINEVFRVPRSVDYGRIPSYAGQQRQRFDYILDRPGFLDEMYRRERPRFPEFDSWTSGMGYHYTSEIFTLLNMVNLDDPTSVFNLNEAEVIGDWSVNMKRYFKLYPMFLNDPNESVVSFAVYEEEELMPKDYFTCDINGDVKSIVPLNPRKMYHVRFNFLWDWSRLSQAALRRLLSLPWLVDELLSFMHDRYGDPDMSLEEWREWFYHVHGRYPTEAETLEFVEAQKNRIKKVNRYPGWVEDWMKEFYLKHGRWPTQDEIDDYYRSMSQSQRDNFFGRVDETDLMKRFIDCYQPYKSPEQLNSLYNACAFRRQGFFNVSVHREADHGSI